MYVEPVSVLPVTLGIVAYVLSSMLLLRVATLVRRMKVGMKIRREIRRKCRLRCDSQRRYGWPREGTHSSGRDQ